MKMRYNASGQISQRESMMLEGRQNNSHSGGQVSRQDYLIILLQGSHPFKPFQRNNACVHTTYMHCGCMFVCVNTRTGIARPFGHLPTELRRYHPEYRNKILRQFRLHVGFLQAKQASSHWAQVGLREVKSSQQQLKLNPLDPRRRLNLL